MAARSRWWRSTTSPTRVMAEEGAVRQVDLQRKYYMSAHDLANRLGLTPPRALALRRELKIDEDENCLHEFVFGTQRHKRYSDNALREMQRVLETIDMDDVWRRHRPRRRRTGT
jgi:prophage antirepressor-like protein